jgi:P4 family phage/plasmid primase-like protien
MANTGNLREFLDSHRADGVWTHTALNGGKYFIPDDDLPRFYELYTESILDQEKQYLTEKCTEIGPLRIDFDFIYEREIQTHQHTREQTMSFCGAYMKEIEKYLNIPDNVQLYIMEKRKPTLDAKKNRMKSGIHIVVPGLSTHKFVEQRVRRTLLKDMDSFFPGLPIHESWEKIYDEGVVNRSVPWTLYGSRKNDPNSLPYMVSYLLDYSRGNGISLSADKTPISTQLMRTLSLRRSDADETPMTEDARKTYASVRDAHAGGDVRISGGRAVTPARGRPAVRGERPSSRGSSPMGRMQRQLDPEEKEYIKAHALNLQPKRSESYAEWVAVGICLHNIHSDLLDVFLDFSAQCGDKYNEADAIQKWNSLTFRNDGERTGLGTLRFWSRTDNPDGYLTIENGNFERLLMTATSGTEHDVASVIYSKFRDGYKCVDFGKNVWYRWSGHIWRETDRGIDLQIKLSREIASEFLKRASRVADEMVQRNLTSCTGDSKKDCGTCEFCQIEVSRGKLMQIWTKLKTTKFKDNVMKECRELFFDEEFIKKVDANKDLIAFNNGILDVTTFEFRDGKPEDYISFSTGIDYDPERPYYDYPEWSAIDTFIKQVLPDPEVRTYFLCHMSTCLIGGNKAQKFHILTGSGSNGKSMIMNLMSKALGDYAAVVPISLFTQKRNKSAAAAPEVIRLKGRRFVTMQEPDERIALNTGLMKEIASSEKMYARDLFKSGCEFEVQAKFHLACNEKPEINTTDGGTWRRLVVVNFVSKFVEHPTESNHFPLDETIQALVTTHEWATVFLSYMVQMLREGKGFYKLNTPAKVMEYTSEYRNENDGIAKFIADRLAPWEEGDEVRAVSRESLLSVFKQWKIQNEQLSLTVSDLQKRVEEKFGKYPRGGGWTKFRLSDV